MASAAAKMEKLRLHDLRHTFASAGLGGGDTLAMIGKLLGHTDPKTTARYAHLGEHPTKLAADRISGAVSKALRGRTDAKNKIP